MSALFPVITSAEWCRSLRDARSSPNAVRAQIRARLLRQGEPLQSQSAELGVTHSKQRGARRPDAIISNL